MAAACARRTKAAAGRVAASHVRNERREMGCIVKIEHIHEGGVSPCTDVAVCVAHMVANHVLRTRTGDHAAKYVLVALSGAFPEILSSHARAGSAAQCCPKHRIVQQPLHCGRERHIITWGNEQTAHAIFDEAWQPADARGDDRPVERHGFRSGDAERLRVG